MPQKPKQQKRSIIEDLAPDFSSSKPVSLKTQVKAKKKQLILILGATVIALLAIFAIKTYTNLREARQELQAIQNDPNAKAKEESKKIVDEVGKLVVLPQGEEPTVATVTDPTKLNDQPFFANSLAGDKVLIYQDAQRAILYRPSENKVIEIAPLNLDGAGVGGIAGEEINSPGEDSRSETDNSRNNRNTTNNNSNTTKKTNSNSNLNN